FLAGAASRCCGPCVPPRPRALFQSSSIPRACWRRRNARRWSARPWQFSPRRPRRGKPPRRVCDGPWPRPAWGPFHRETRMASNPPTILMVDDTEASRYAVSRILRKANYQVQEAATGQDALRQAAAGADLVILDIQLPDMNGYEVCQRLKANPATAA